MSTDNVDHIIVIHCAIRYALGRSSYAPGAVMDYVRSVRDQLTAGSIVTIQRDIADHLKEYPNTSQAAEWRKFSEEL